MGLDFEVLATSGKARRGRLTTAHGVIETPAFMPVGTLGAVKGLGPLELEDAGASIMLSNLYHLTLRPGIDRIEELGGLHRFTGWSRPLITDSGGYQVFSLASLRELDDAGVTFRSHLDGSRLRFTPASVVEAQRRLGVDLAMVLDECPPWPVTEEAAASSWELTLSWARASREAWVDRPGHGLFGIAQGSVYRRLRERAVEQISELGFDGYALGGVSVGESPEHRRTVVEWCADALPAAKPRYLMGVGFPEDILHAVRHGIDLFDCVLPARNARHGVLFTREGLLRIKHSQYRYDDRPADPECGCPACQRVSRAFLHHLAKTGEITGKVLATLHNLRYYLDFMQDLREAIGSEALGEVASKYAASDRREPR